MIKLKIDQKIIEVEEGTSVLKAAEKAGVAIPTMCYNDEVEHFTSCMICLVKDAANGKLIPSCSIEAYEGMEIVTMDDEIWESRKTALELLLSEHVGDCEAPCTMACPAHMNIPQMNRLLARDKVDEALSLIKKDIALPSVLGYICPAPCEGVCRRKPIDGAVSICLLKRFAGDIGNIKEPVGVALNKNVAIIGAGPAGLAATYYLRKAGVHCEVFEKEKQPGGIIQNDIQKGKLPLEVLLREVSVIEEMGAVFHYESEISGTAFNDILSKFDAVVMASGAISDAQMSWGLENSSKGFIANPNTFQTSNEKVFAVGNAVKSSKLVIRSLAQGKEATVSILQFLKKDELVGVKTKFNSKFGKLVMPEFSEYLKESVEGNRIEPANGLAEGLTIEEVKEEAARCLHCDCRKIDNCKLRDLSDEYKAVQKRFDYSPRKNVRKKFNHESIVYEPGKCIKCGLCVRITARYQEDYGMTFIGRGFDVEVGVPFNETLSTGLIKVAEKAADACPTGALSRK